MPCCRNPKALPGCAYEPTHVEHVANVLSHGLALPAGGRWALTLIRASVTEQQTWVSYVYGGAIVMLFLSSTVYHSACLVGKWPKLQLWLHVGDRATIYVFIAASYTPWLTLRSGSSIAAGLRSWIWIFAALGISYQYLFHERFKIVEIVIYVLVGALPGIVLLFALDSLNGVPMMIVGGLAYLIGVFFFKSDGHIPFAHALWHLHVVLGVYCHYRTTLSQLLG